MFAIILNAVAIFIGSALGALFQRGISEKYVNVLNTAMGLCAITLGMNVAIESMQKTQYPVLFIFCLSIGGLIGTLLKMDQRMENATRSISGSNLGEGITTGVLLCCVGTLAMMGPVMSALYNDNTYLMTAATLNFVTVLVLASSYGFGIALVGVVVFIWMSSIYGLALLSRDLISEELICEVGSGRYPHCRFGLGHLAHQGLQDHQPSPRTLHANGVLRCKSITRQFRHPLLNRKLSIYCLRRRNNEIYL